MAESNNLYLHQADDPEKGIYKVADLSNHKNSDRPAQLGDETLTVGTQTSPTAILFDSQAPTVSRALAIRGNLDGPHVPIPPPSGAVIPPPASSNSYNRPWFLLQMWVELTLAFRMYFDSRYRISRTAQFLFPAILILFALNYLLFSTWFSIPILSPVLERIGCVLLGIFSYKVLARELQRYREVLDYLMKHGSRWGP